MDALQGQAMSQEARRRRELELKKISAGNPDLYKYAAIYHVNSFFQYGTALENMKAYVKLRPEDPFGHDFIRFLQHRLRQ